MASTSNVRIGACEVYLDRGDGNGEQDLGHTQGGVELTIGREFESLFVDKYGRSPIDLVYVGGEFTIKVMMAETVISKLRHAMPEATYAAAGTDGKLGIGAAAGKLMSTVAGALRLHPLSKSPSDRSEDVYMFKAVSAEPIETAYKVDEQRLYEVTFKALVDASQPEGYILGRFGDPDIS